VAGSVISGLPLRSRAVAGVSQRDCLGPVLASRAPSPTAAAAAAAAWRGLGLVPIAGWRAAVCCFSMRSMAHTRCSDSINKPLSHIVIDHLQLRHN